MLSALDVARYLLSLEDESEGDTISNLKLQKLLYYAQGYYLAIYGEPLFGDEIRAWTHGPVVIDVWQVYRSYGSKSLPIPTDIDFDLYSSQIKDFLNEIHKAFGQFSAWKLRNLTHEEPPWRDADRDDVITLQSLMGYFREQ